jgi:squalene-hopene/tetraprenyl-beta-curcumene cyclase
MNLEVDVERLVLAHKAVRAELLAERAPDGSWTGQISGSPVATAAAVSALVVSHRQDSDDALRAALSGNEQVIEQLVRGDLSELLLQSVHWLARRQNADGGWGDCDGAGSNIAATMLVQAAFRLTGIPAKYADLMASADRFVASQGGVAGLRRRIGRDKSYFAPILANCALADMIPWRQVPTLRFERWCLPRRWQREIQLAVPRCAAPIAIAVGMAKFHNDPPHNPIARLVRRSLWKKAMVRLGELQAADESFLASPLVTAFVVMSLAGMGCREHAIVERGVEFLLSSVRADASWSVATNFATVNTVLAFNGLAAEPVATSTSQQSNRIAGVATASHWRKTATARAANHDRLPAHVLMEADHEVSRAAESDEPGALSEQCVGWLLNSQRSTPSALIDAPVGGWGVSDAPGAEPNTVATAGALLVLARACCGDDAVRLGRIERAASLGVGWLLAMQNDDGGWPTYCRDDDTPLGGSGIDPTAQALQALAAWQRFWKAELHRGTQSVSSALVARIAPAIERAMQYLESNQRDDGSFVPLWFGNAHQADDQNPVMGTAQVLSACAEVGGLDSGMVERATAWLLAAQHADGGWGPPRAPVDYSGNERERNARSWRENEAQSKFCSVEETAAAVSALIPLSATNPALERSLSRGLAWLTNAVEQDRHRQPAIIGFQLSQIWYYDRLYPQAFAAAALSRAMAVLTSATPAEMSTR